MPDNIEQLEKYADKVFNRLNYFNDYVLRTIAERIKNIGSLSAYDQQTLKNMADISGDMKAITKKLARITKMNIADIEKIYAQTVKLGDDEYKPLYDFRNMKPPAFKENDFAQKLVRHWVRQTVGEMINLSKTKALYFDKYNLRGEVIGRTPLEGTFQKVVDDAVIALSTGTVDFDTAMRETVRNLGGSGVKVVYGGGKNRSLPVVVRQSLLYGAKQAALAYDEYIGEELGCNGFEVDAHSGCRPTHEVIQGQMYAYGDDDVEIDGVTYLSENKDLGGGKSALELLNDYGCLHFKTSVILGISPPRYSDDELEEIRRETTELIEYGGKKKTLYEWKQSQRALERAVRKEMSVRNMAEAAGDKLLVKECDEKIGIYRKKYDDMCDKLGLEPKLERMRAYKGTVDKSGKSGIIESEVKINMSINNIYSPIEQRNTAKGNPNAILQMGRPLNNRQKSLLDNLNSYDSRIIVNKKSVNMKDLSALTAVTGDEFALFTKGKNRLVIRGNRSSVNIDIAHALELSKQGYKWSGHTHPGVDWNSSMPSGGDKEILRCFKQGTSVIYDSKGQYRTFEKE